MWLCRFANLSTWTAPPGSLGRRRPGPGLPGDIAYGRAVLERYDDEASRVVSAAREEASRLGHGHVGTEHLLLGLLRQRGSHAAEALDASGVFLEPCRQKVSEALASRVTPQATGVGSQLPFTDRASRALDRASRLSLRLGGDVVRSDQILLSVLDVEGTAGQVLRGLSVDPAVVRDALMAEAALSPAPSRSNPRRGSPTGRGLTTGRVEGIRRAGLQGMRWSAQRLLEQVELPVGSGEQASVPKVKVVFCARCGTAIGVLSSGGL